MNRRTFLSTLGVAGLAASPLVVQAQQAGQVYRIGILQPVPNSPAVNYTEALRQGLRDHGYVEG